MASKTVSYHVAYRLSPSHFDEDESDIITASVDMPVPGPVNSCTIRKELQKKEIRTIGTIVAFSKNEVL